MESDNRKTALYCRVARDDIGDSSVIEKQRDNLREFAIWHGFDNFEEYLDNGYSGSSLDRPAFARMDADIKAGKIETVIVLRIDRVARNFLLADNWIKDLEAHDVRFIATDDTPELPVFMKNILRELLLNRQRKSVGIA
jgi:DNA invertase Pin-like site-specific DNA recombinase